MNIPDLIQQYERGATKLHHAIQGLSPEDFHATPVPNTWSIAQITLHLMDSDLIASDRMKRVIAEENPAIIGFNETLFAKNLSYDKLDPFLAADIFKLNRQLTTVILKNLPPAAFARIGTHNEAGKLTLQQLLETYVNHLDHHLKFLHEKRKLLGKSVTEK
jgi:uncharacterized damage-inducible protein DinB